LNFNEERKIEILESNNSVEIKKKVYFFKNFVLNYKIFIKLVEINTFLSRSYDPEKIQILNESTSSNPPKKHRTYPKKTEESNIYTNASEEGPLLKKEKD